MKTFDPEISHPVAVLKPVGLTVVRCSDCGRTWHTTPAAELRAIASYVAHECEETA